MPYIPYKRRLDFAYPSTPDTAGELNFLITQLVLEYLGEDYNYDAINSAVGALECAKLELYRRVAVPYEDQKISENGDVY